MTKRMMLMGGVLSSVGCFNLEKPTFSEGVCEQVIGGALDWDENTAVLSLFEEPVNRTPAINLDPGEVKTIGVLTADALTHSDAESIIDDLIVSGFFWRDRAMQRCQLSPVFDGSTLSVQVDLIYEVCTNWCWTDIRSVAIRIDEASGLVEFVGTESMAIEG